MRKSRGVVLLVAAGMAFATAGALVPSAERAAVADDATASAERLLANADWNERIKAFDLLDELKGNAKAEALAAKALKDDDWGVQIDQETMKQIAPDYSMFRMIVNVVREKSEWVENL